jgi:hypothetical protein
MALSIATSGGSPRPSPAATRVAQVRVLGHEPARLGDVGRSGLVVRAQGRGERVEVRDHGVEGGPDQRVGVTGPEPALARPVHPAQHAQRDARRARPTVEGLARRAGHPAVTCASARNTSAVEVAPGSW